jgi:hypothetical protein
VRPGPDRPDDQSNVHVAVQHRNKPSDLMGPEKADMRGATCVLEYCPIGGDITCPNVQGGPAGPSSTSRRGMVDEEGTFIMFRRNKLMDDGVPSWVSSP